MRLLLGALLGATFTALASTACGSDSASGPEPGPQPGPAPTDSALIQVDNATTYQTIDGFGATTLTLVYPDGDHLGTLRPAAIKAAYGDVGMSVGTLNAGVVESPASASDVFGQRANDNADPFVLDPQGVNFYDSDILRERILSPAAVYGYDDVTLGPLLNLRGAVDWLKPIRSADYTRYLDEAAENVVALAQHWRDAYGITPRLLDLWNEPTSGNTELQSTSTQEVVDLVKQIGARLRAEGFPDAKFLVPNEETIGRSLQVAQAILADPVARQYVGAIGYHAYPLGSVYSSPRRILETSGNGTPDAGTRQELEQLKALGQQYGIPIWFTEVTENLGVNDYAFGAIENVLARAIHIHDNFEYAGASAFFGMNMIWDSRTHAEHFAGRNVPFLSEQSSIVLVDVSTGAIELTGMAYAIGHYARWIRPGAVRIDASSAKPRVIATAFRDPPNRRIVLVVVNNESSAQRLRVRLSGASARGGATGELSYGSVRWQTISSFLPGSDGVFETAAPARSVVSLAIPVD